MVYIWDKIHSVYTIYVHHYLPHYHRIQHFFNARSWTCGKDWGYGESQGGSNDLEFSICGVVLFESFGWGDIILGVFAF